MICKKRKNHNILQNIAFPEIRTSVRKLGLPSLFIFYNLGMYSV